MNCLQNCDPARQFQRNSRNLHWFGAGLAAVGGLARRRRRATCTVESPRRASLSRAMLSLTFSTSGNKGEGKTILISEVFTSFSIYAINAWTFTWETEVVSSFSSGHHRFDDLYCIGVLCAREVDTATQRETYANELLAQQPLWLRLAPLWLRLACVPSWLSA